MQRVVVVKHENLIDILLQATFMVNFQSHGEVKIIIYIYLFQKPYVPGLSSQEENFYF
jgi:hypothetical protein